MSLPRMKQGKGKHRSLALLAGNRTSQALLGMQLQPRDLEEFEQVTKALEAEFSFTTLAGEARRVFDMFIQ